MATILIVDDDEETRELLLTWLAEQDFDVLAAENGMQAIEMAGVYLPDLILLDVMMPGINGIETCKKLRQDEHTTHIPVVLATAYDPPSSRVEALMAGASDYISKPFDLRALTERLRVLLAHDDELIDQSKRLIRETVDAALSILPCNLAWLLTIDAFHGKLVSQAATSSKGLFATSQFEKQLAEIFPDSLLPLQPDDNLLAQVALTSAALLNLSHDDLQETDPILYSATQPLGIYFLSIVPLQISGTPMGVMVIGGQGQLDVDTTRGKQLLAAVTDQAATIIYNAQLMYRLSEREAESNRDRAFRQTLLDTMADGLVVYDENGTISYVNRRLKFMVGQQTGALTETRVDKLFSAADQQQASELVQGTAGEGVTRSFEMNLLQKNGDTLPVLAVQASPLAQDDYEAPVKVMVLTDLSNQKAREQGLTKQAHRLQALNHATQTITSTLSLDETIRTILTEASNVLEATIASLLLLTSDGKQLVYRATVGPHAGVSPGSTISISQGVAGYVARTGEAIMVEDTLHDTRFPNNPEIAGVAPKSAAAAPLILNAKIIGVVEVVHENAGAFDQADLDTLVGLTQSAAIALSNAQIYENVQQHVRELTLLLKTSEAASSTLAIEQVLETVAQQLIETLNVKWCVISSWDRESDQLVHLAEAANIEWPEDKKRQINLKEYGLAAHAIQTGKPIAFTVNELDKLPDMKILPANISAVLLVPILVKGKIVGLAELCQISAEQNFDQEQVSRSEATVKTWEGLLGRVEEWQESDRIQQLTKRLLKTTDALRCSIYSYEQVNQSLNTLYETSQVVWALGRGPEYPLSKTSLRRIALIERTPVTARVGDTDFLPTGRTTLPLLETGVMLFTPLIAQGKSIGLVQLVDIDPQRQFTSNDLSLAQAIGNVVGNALENARLYSMLFQRAAQLEAAYNDLREAEKLKAEWIQNVSHELRTPLTSLIGYIDLMTAGDLGPTTDDQEEGLTVMKNKSRQLSHLVEDMLTIQLVEHDLPDRTLIGLQDIAKAATNALRPVAIKQRIEIVLKAEETLPEIMIDAKLLLRVFDNLLSNAIKFSPDGGNIIIEIVDNGPTITTSIIDEGIGISPNDHEKIWHRFYQVDGSMTRQFGGTGLGLAIVKEIIERHDGSIWVESTPNKGSTFSFNIPKMNPADYAAGFEE